VLCQRTHDLLECPGASARVMVGKCQLLHDGGLPIASGCFWPILLKSRPWFAHQKSTSPRLKSSLLADASGLGFHVAVKKGVFTSQWLGSLGRPTFSTESAVFCLWRPAEARVQRRGIKHRLGASSDGKMDMRLPNKPLRSAKSLCY